MRSGIVNQSQNESVRRLATINQSDSASKKKTHWVRTNLLQSMQNNASHPCYILLSIFPGCLVWGDHCKNCHQPSRSSHPACCIWHSRCLMCGTPSHTGHYIHSGWQCATYAQWGETNIPIKYVCPIYIQLVEEWSSFFFFNSNTTKPKATVSYWNPIWNQHIHVFFMAANAHGRHRGLVRGSIFVKILPRYVPSEIQATPKKKTLEFNRAKKKKQFSI